MKCRKSGLFGFQWPWLLAFLLGAMPLATAQVADPGTPPYPPLESNMSESKPKATSSWDSIDSLLSDLIAESEASVQDWIALSARLGALQTEASALLRSLAESRQLYETSESSRKTEREAATGLILEERKRALALEKQTNGLRLALEIGIPVALGLGIAGGIWLSKK